MDEHIRKESDPFPVNLQLFGLLAIALLTAIYFLLRYGGHWSVGGDTAAATMATRLVLDTGQLAPDGATGVDGSVYPNGYGYQALLILLTNLTGMPISTLQIYGAALLAAWIVLPAWLLYREWTGTSRGAFFATLILIFQPELLFAISRGTHEKFSRGLMLICLYFLVRGIRFRHHRARWASSVIGFYLVIYALIAFNSLLANSFLTTILLALLLMHLISRRSRLSGEVSPFMKARLPYVLVSSLLLAFLFIFYAYKPALHSIEVLQGVGERVSVLFLDVDAQPVDPYSKWVIPAWTSLTVYFLMTLGNWLLLLGSAVLWTRQTVVMVWHRRFTLDEPRLLLWAFFGASGVIGALSILVDFSGALGATIQHRFFPSLAMIAAPVIGEWLNEQSSSRTAGARLARSAVVIAIFAVAGLSILKATNEPLLSNKWLFFLESETQALDWAEGALAGRKVWTGFDGRLIDAARNLGGGAPGLVEYDRVEPDPGTRDLLISTITQNRSSRLGIPLPLEWDSLLTYDNGQTQVYHLRPRTPYQP